MAMQPRRLPIGTSAFGNIRRRGFYYVDKTPYLDAMAQIREKGYADKYRMPGKEIHRLGLVFDQAQRNLAALRAERA